MSRPLWRWPVALLTATAFLYVFRHLYSALSLTLHASPAEGEEGNSSVPGETPLNPFSRLELWCKGPLIPTPGAASPANETLSLLFPVPKYLKLLATTKRATPATAEEGYVMVLTAPSPALLNTLQAPAEAFCSSPRAFHRHMLKVQIVLEDLPILLPLPNKYLNHSYPFSSTSIGARSMSNNDELYELKYDAVLGIVRIAVNDLKALTHAFSSLHQLLGHSSYIPSSFHLIDWPDNKWRGILLDLSRHYLPIKLLKRTVDAMQASRLNVLHLHLTDSQSFPLLLEDVDIWIDDGQPSNSSALLARPWGNYGRGAKDGEAGELRKGRSVTLHLSNLARYGAFSAEKMYTRGQLADLVQYAQARGVEVVPEVDMPAHALSWGKAFAGMVVNCTSAAKASPTPGNIYPLDPSHPLTFHVIYHVLLQLAPVFPSKYFHIGGDEVNTKCYLEDKRLMAWASSHLGGSADETQGKQRRSTSITLYFEEQVFAMVRELGKIPIVWQGLIDSDDLPSEGDEEQPLSEQALNSSRGANKPVTIVQPWKCWGGLALRSATTAVHSGHPLVMSACWYLDYNEDWVSFLTSDMINAAASVLSSPTTNPSSARSQPAHRLKSSAFRTRKGRRLVPSGWESTEERTLAEVAANGTHLQPSAQENELVRLQQLHQDYFMGGEGSLWTEKVDHTNFECRLWPRAGAIATRLWGLGAHFDYTTEPLERERGSVQPGNDRAQLFLNKALVQLLYLAFVKYRYYLRDVLYVNSAAIVFHEEVLLAAGERPAVESKKSRRRSSAQRWVFIPSPNESDAVRRIRSRFGANKSAARGSDDIGRDSLMMTSQCLGIPEEIQRPVTSSHVAVTQLNVADGSTGDRGVAMLRWLQDRASDGYAVVGFCELNGWDEPQSTTDLVKNRNKLTFKAANAGYVHSYIMTNQQPYNLGITSVYPFAVMGEWGPPLFQRGLLHVYFDKLDLHVIIAHLHAHSSSIRATETAFIATSILGPLLAQKSAAKVVLMGDLNTLSPADREQHVHMGFVDFLLSQAHPTFKRFAAKYLDSDQLRISYEPMLNLLNTGMLDSCVEFCRRLSCSSDSSFLSWSSVGDSPYSKCMQSQCAYTEPTLFNPEWPFADIPHPAIRLDYILVSPSILARARIRPTDHLANASAFSVSTFSQRLKNRRNTDLQWEPTASFLAGVDMSPATKLMSDHFPVYAAWMDDISEAVELFA